MGDLKPADTLEQKFVSLFFKFSHFVLVCFLFALTWQLILPPQAKTVQMPPDTRFPEDEGCFAYFLFI